uniref:Uncharacterized protein n=1 Tax=Leviviridae sp. TaxID=2027243 RepID=A0A514D1H0_9VIRU|nr:MAG: hypothetical protein H4Bulk48212_000004 [Leviviridae sp.]
MRTHTSEIKKMTTEDIQLYLLQHKNSLVFEETNRMSTRWTSNMIRIMERELSVRLH